MRDGNGQKQGQSTRKKKSRDASETDVPRICIALDRAINEAGLTSRAVAEHLDVDESSVSRWRTGVYVPDRDTIECIEEILGKRRGYVSRLAGYVHDEVRNALMLSLIENDLALTEGWRRIVSASYREALRASKEELKAQSSSVRRQQRRSSSE